jgi:branched-chain amino acid aminotransferase
MATKRKSATSQTVWLDGKLVDREHAVVSVFDHGLLYGDGVFEGIRAYNGEPFRLAEHVARLFASAHHIMLQIPYTRQQIADAIRETVAANGLAEAYIRPVVTRGVGYLGLAPNRVFNPTTFIIADQISLYPDEMYEQGMPVIVSTVCRNHPNALPPQLKSCNYLNNILAKIDAMNAGVPEAIMLNGQGFVAECTGENVFVVRGGRIRTPSLDQGALEGITRRIVIDLCAEMGIPAAEGVVTRHDLYLADEVFITGTAAEVIGIREIDKRKIGAGVAGPVTRRIMAAFHDLTRGKPAAAKTPRKRAR